jgi:hypothetical protein
MRDSFTDSSHLEPCLNTPIGRFPADTGVSDGNPAARGLEGDDHGE